MSRKCCKMKKSKFSGTLNFKQTNIDLVQNIPDTTVVEKKQVWLIDVAIRGDSRINQKEVEKITKYQDQKVKVERLWEKKATVVPVVIGAL